MTSPRHSSQRFRVGVLVSAALLAAATGCNSKGADSHAAGSKPQAVAVEPDGTTHKFPKQKKVDTANSRVLHAKSASPASIGGCPMFPADNIWNKDISGLPVSSKSSTYINSIGASGSLHPDFGSGTYQGDTIGMPLTYVEGGQPEVNVTFDFDDESDHVGYPIPPDAKIEDGDGHVLVVNKGTCKLYELYDAQKDKQDSNWHAGSGAVFDLNSNNLRPDGWTSADAAGLPITAGLARFDEVQAGKIDHALRITVPRSADDYIWPARHSAGSSDSSLPPMGLRLRLKAGVDISGYPQEDQVILQALKTYGAFVADNGSAWYVSGTNEDGWDNDTLNALKNIKGSDFEAVDESSLMVDENSGQSR
jgi:hypothetical protein